MSARNYLDFDLQIDELENGTFRARVLDSPVGQAETTFNFPFKSHELEIFFLRISRPRRGVRKINSPEMEEVRQFGSKLYDAVFQNDLETCLLRSIDQAEQQGSALRVRLRLPPSLIEMPWEFLYDSSRDRFLAHSVNTPIVRYLDLSQTVRPLTVNGPLKMLVMVSSPEDYDQLDVEAEWQKIVNAVADLKARGLIEIVRLPQATLAALQRQLRRDQYHIFHFIGHGGFDERSNDGVLLLEDENRRSRQISGNYLGTLLHDHPSLRLAMLNACEGGRSDQSDPFAGVAQQLLRQGIPAVIAMQFEITDKAAITLAKEFYNALADGYPVDGALAEARKAIFIEGNDIEWGTPVLYLRSEDGRLFDVAKQPETAHKQPESEVIEIPRVVTPNVLGQSTFQRWWIAALIMTILVAGLWFWQPWNKGTLPTTPTESSAQSANDTPTLSATAETVTETPTVVSEIANIDPISRTILQKKADDLLGNSDYEQSKSIYEQLLADNPNDINVLLGLAKAYRYDESPETEALQVLSRAANVEPDNPKVNIELGIIYREVYENFEQSVQFFSKAKASGNQDLMKEILFGRASAYHASGKYQEALADWTEIIGIDPNSDHYVARAATYLAQGDNDAAERDYSEAIKLRPEVGKYYLYRAEFYALNKHIDKAVADYKKFLEYREQERNAELIEKAEKYVEQYRLKNASGD